MRRSETAAKVAVDLTGWVTEWSIVHAWKACVPKGTEGSNPSPSASSRQRNHPACNLALFIRITRFERRSTGGAPLRARVKSEGLRLKPKRAALDNLSPSA